MNKSTASNLLIPTATAVALFQPFVAFAQEAGLEEVVVTAQRREQRLQDVGVSVTAVTGEVARELGVFDSKDIARIAPGVIFDSTAGGAINSNLTIRGVSQSDFSANQESPNSIYIDDVYVSSSSAAAFQLYDVARIEVLRGPQGTLFGRASSGGLVNFISNRPTAETSGYAEVGVGSFSGYYGEAAIGGSLTDNIRGRLSGRIERADGWFENKAAGGENAFETNQYGLRGQLEADLSDVLTARLSISFDKSPRYNAGIYKTDNAYVNDAGIPAPLPATLDFYGTGPGNDFTGYRNPFSDKQTGNFNNVGFFENQKVSPTLFLDWKLGSASISSITNFTAFEFKYNEDCDGGPTDFCNFPITQNLDQFSEEVRATGGTDRLTWTTGLYYLNVDQDAAQNFSFPALSGTDFAFSDANPVHQKLTSLAAFGQLEYKLTDTLTGTVGLRYTHDKKTFESQVFFLELGNGYSGGTGSEIFSPPLLVYDFNKASVGDLASSSEGMWSGKVQLDYRPADAALYYVSVSRGVKGAGFNTNVSGNLTNDETPFDSENVIAYEAGAKLEFLDHRLRVNSSIYFYDYSAFQGFAFNGLQGVVGNYDGTFKGGELELTAAPGAGWMFGLSASYMDSLLKDIPTVYSGIRDQQSILAPKWTSNGYIRKTLDLGSGRLGLQWSFDYLADRYASIENTFGTFVPGSFLHNARVSYELPESGVEVAAWVNNIADAERMNFSFDLIASTGSLLQSYAKPRMYGLSIRKNF
jgi:iron complex outermembrane recepter protein